MLEPKAFFSVFEEMKSASNRLGLIQLPKSIEAWVTNKTNSTAKLELKRGMALINEHLASTGREELKTAVAIESRNRPDYSSTIKYDEIESTAYAATRMPVTFAALMNIFGQVRKRAPDFCPSTCLDFGIGSGSAIWAANETFKIKSATGIDISEPMLNICRELNALAAGPKLDLQRYVNFASKDKFDLVSSSFTLSEIQDSNARTRALRYLWDSTQDVLVLVERGTPIGFNHIESYRQHILDMASTSNTDVHVVAPVRFPNLVSSRKEMPND